MKKISIVVPIHNEQDNIHPLYDQVTDVLEKLNYDWEIIFVDDGSTDRSPQIIYQLENSDSRIKLLEFSRNFGKEMAMTAGIHRSTGDAILMMDSDLQHPPELIPEFIREWETGASVVVGVRSANTNEGLLKKVGSYFFYKILSMISETRITPSATDFRLIDREVADQFKKFPEHSRITRGLIDWLGYDQRFITFKANERFSGTASYGAYKLFRLAFSSFIAHSLFPLKLAGYLGIAIIFVSGPLGLFILIEKYFMNDPLGLNITGSATLGVMLLFLVGIMLSCLGLITLYIGSIHEEVNNRPIYVIRQRRRNENLDAELARSQESQEWRSRSADRRDFGSAGYKT